MQPCRVFLSPPSQSCIRRNCERSEPRNDKLGSKPSGFSQIPPLWSEEVVVGMTNNRRAEMLAYIHKGGRMPLAGIQGSPDKCGSTAHDRVLQVLGLVSGRQRKKILLFNLGSDVNLLTDSSTSERGSRGRNDKKEENTFNNNEKAG